MGNFFKKQKSGGFGGRGSSGPSRYAGKKRSFGGGSSQMYDVICSRCKKECQVPFRPTGSKPVLCSECFRGEGKVNSEYSASSSSSSGSSSEQFKQINSKLDKILLVLQQLELDTDDLEEDVELDEDEDDEEEDDDEVILDDSEDDEEEEEEEDFKSDK